MAKPSPSYSVMVKSLRGASPRMGQSPDEDVRTGPKGQAAPATASETGTCHGLVPGRGLMSLIIHRPKDVKIRPPRGGASSRCSPTYVERSCKRETPREGDIGIAPSARSTPRSTILYTQIRFMPTIVYTQNHRGHGTSLGTPAQSVNPHT